MQAEFLKVFLPELYHVKQAILQGIGSYDFEELDEGMYVDAIENFVDGIGTDSESAIVIDYEDLDAQFTDVTLDHDFTQAYYDNRMLQASVLKYQGDTWIFMKQYFASQQEEQKIASSMDFPIISLLMNDVHYYLSDIKLGYDCMMYITGAEFFSLPGIYVLPFGQGRYTLITDKNHDGHVTMNTNGNSQAYSHPLVVVPDQCVRFDYGWYSHFQKIFSYKKGKEMPFYKIKVPYTPILKSIQATYAVNEIKKSSLELKSMTVSRLYQ